MLRPQSRADHQAPADERPRSISSAPPFPADDSAALHLDGGQRARLATPLPFTIPDSESNGAGGRNEPMARPVAVPSALEPSRHARSARRQPRPSPVTTPIAGAVPIPGDLLTLVYGIVITMDVVLIVATLFWDMGYTLPRGFGQLDLRSEGRAAVWYSSMLLLLAGSAAAIIAYSPTSRGISPAWSRFSWMLVGGVFCYLSLDEMLEIHEWAGRAFSLELMEVEVLIDVFAWVLALLPFIAVFVVVLSILIRQVLSTNQRSRRFAILGLACWIGVLICETVEAQMARLDLYRWIQGTIEEGLEITGTTLFLIAFCEYLRRLDANRPIVRTDNAVATRH